MHRKRSLFFTTKEDISPIIKAVEAKFEVTYYQTGLFDDRRDRAYYTAEELPNFATPAKNDWIHDNKYMMLPRHQRLIIRDIPQRKGGIKHGIDSVENRNSVNIQFGGIVRDGLLIHGAIAIDAENSFELAVFNEFMSVLRKNTRTIQAFYIGRNAEEKLKAGWRLVQAEQQPTAYDLIWEEPKSKKTE